jgi:hypothetical protein
MAKDGASCKIAWRQMIDVAQEFGISNIQKHGFMANDANAGYNAIRKFFTGGVCDPNRERSNAFHWAQSIC